AEHLRQSLGASSFNNTVSRTFSDSAIQKPSGITAIEQLPRLAFGPVITTNFDHVLEKVFRDAGRPFRLLLWGGKADLGREALVEDYHVLLKLHGDAADAEDRVLSAEEY